MNERMEMVQHADTERTGKEPRSPVGASLKPGSGTTAKVEQRHEPAKHVSSVSYPPPRANWRLRSHSCQKKKKKERKKFTTFYFTHAHTHTCAVWRVFSSSVWKDNVTGALPAPSKTLFPFKKLSLHLRGTLSPSRLRVEVRDKERLGWGWDELYFISSLQSCICGTHCRRHG